MASSLCERAKIEPMADRCSVDRRWMRRVKAWLLVLPLLAAVACSSASETHASPRGEAALTPTTAPPPADLGSLLIDLSDLQFQPVTPSASLSGPVDLEPLPSETATSPCAAEADSVLRWGSTASIIWFSWCRATTDAVTSARRHRAQDHATRAVLQIWTRQHEAAVTGVFEFESVTGAKRWLARQSSSAGPEFAVDVPGARLATFDQTFSDGVFFHTSPLAVELRVTAFAVANRGYLVAHSWYYQYANDPAGDPGLIALLASRQSAVG